MEMKTPVHPGKFLKEDCIEPSGLTITEAAKKLKISRQILSQILNGKTGISAEMALKISKVFGGSPETWLKLQIQYDLSVARAKINLDDYETVQKSA